MLSFDESLTFQPERWIGPQVEVLDTASQVRRWLLEHECMSPEALVGLTALILQREVQSRSQEEED